LDFIYLFIYNYINNYFLDWENEDLGEGAKVFVCLAKVEFIVHLEELKIGRQTRGRDWCN
jgi:hypothetical protein